MTTELVLAPQKHKKRGWILVFDNKFWGETTPEDRSHGGGGAGYGWTNNISKVCVAQRDKMPTTKGYFTYAANTYEIDRMSKGEWVQVEVTTCYSLDIV